MKRVEGHMIKGGKNGEKGRNEIEWRHREKSVKRGIRREGRGEMLGTVRGTERKEEALIELKEGMGQEKRSGGKVFTREREEEAKREAIGGQGEKGVAEKGVEGRAEEETERGGRGRGGKGREGRPAESVTTPQLDPGSRYQGGRAHDAGCYRDETQEQLQILTQIRTDLTAGNLSVRTDLLPTDSARRQGRSWVKSEEQDTYTFTITAYGL